jgi:hypothetical protein
MANPRQHERPFESATDLPERKIVEEATRATRNIADFGEQAARTNFEMV